VDFPPSSTLTDYSRVVTHYYFRVPFIVEPPRSPLPDPEENPAWYGELVLKYPQSPVMFATNFGRTIKRLADLRVILNTLSTSAFDNQKSPKGLTTQQAVSYIQQLENWYLNLPEPLSPSKIVLPAQLKLQ
jgi:hypothetical protein